MLLLGAPLSRSRRRRPPSLCGPSGSLLFATGRARRSVDPAGTDLLGVHLEREVDEVDDRQRPACVVACVAAMACAGPHRVRDSSQSRGEGVPDVSRRHIPRTPRPRVTTPKTLMNAKSLSLSFRNFSFSASCSASMRACSARFSASLGPNIPYRATSRAALAVVARL